MNTGRSAARRVLDGLFGLVTWVAAAAVVLWFYDWVNRWYVVVGVLLALVVGAIVAERLNRPDVADQTALEPLANLVPAPLAHLVPAQLASDLTDTPALP